MATEPLRVITDRWEWASIAQLVPTVYHELSWTLASVDRLKDQYTLPIAFGYARVWVDDTLIGCPLIRLGDRWFNTPRSAPLVLRGVKLNASAALSRALARHPRFVKDGDFLLDLHSDHELLESIERTRLLLVTTTPRVRRYRAMSERELNALTAPPGWRAALRLTWRADWSTELHVHLDTDDNEHGYTVWAHRNGIAPECIGALAVNQPALEWTVSR